MSYRRYILVKNIESPIPFRVDSEYKESFHTIDEFINYMERNLAKNRSADFIKSYVKFKGCYSLESHTLFDSESEHNKKSIGLLIAELRENRLSKILDDGSEI